MGKRLRLEAQIAARLLHDNVVRIYDFGQAEATWYLVMEQVDGTSYVKRWRALTLAERLRILAQVADALDYAHHQGVIHRDIKPGNVLLTATDVPKLSDFGLSLMAEQADEAGSIRGTPHYMSPEQSKGKRLDFRTDLYSLGVMLYESATGTVPFTGTPMSVMAQHAGTPPEPPRSRNPGISQPLEQLDPEPPGQETRRTGPPAGRPWPTALRDGDRADPRRGARRRRRPAAPDGRPPALDLAALAKLEEEAEAAPGRRAARPGPSRAAAAAAPTAPPGRSRRRPARPTWSPRPWSARCSAPSSRSR